MPLRSPAIPSAPVRLTDDELRDVLARAEEIQRASRHPAAVNAELEAVIGAAEEVGIARAAVERALRERLDLAPEPPAVGALSYARSADGNFHVAEVLEVGPASARVRFLRGSEHEVTLDHLRPCSFIPGEKVMVNWPWWGPWNCTIESYDATKRKLKVNDGWGYTRTFPIAEVWLAPPKRGMSRARVAAALLGAGAAVGALAGALITGLVLR